MVYVVGFGEDIGGKVLGLWVGQGQRSVVQRMHLSTSALSHAISEFTKHSVCELVWESDCHLFLRILKNALSEGHLGTTRGCAQILNEGAMLVLNV